MHIHAVPWFALSYPVLRTVADRVRGCLPRDRCDEVRQRQCAGYGDEDRSEREGWLGQQLELGGENAPCPPAARDTGGQPDEQRDRRDRCGLPPDGMPDLPPDEPE